MTEKMKDVLLTGELVVSFTVPTKMTNEAYQAWTYGGERIEKAITDGLKKELGLNEKEFLVTAATEKLFSKMVGPHFAVKNAIFQITGTIDKKNTCRDCGYIPDNQTEKFCSNCGKELFEQ